MNVSKFFIIIIFGIAGNISAQTFVDPLLYGVGGDETHAPLIKPVPGDIKLRNAPYLNTKLPLEKRIDDLMSKMTDEEKVNVFYGSGPMATGNFPRLGIPTIAMADGPQGVRLDKGVATGFPCGIAMAATWNTSLIEDLGRAIGRECLAFNRRIIFGPGVNMMRSPLGGRNFEYFGEDPVLTGKIGAAYIRGTQAEGVASCPKHFVLNDQEINRNTINISCDARAIHEIYAKPFEIIQREARPWMIMTSNSKVFGDYASESKKMLQGLLFKKIGFDGVVISDWGAVHNEDKGINSGCTLIMPEVRKNARSREILRKMVHDTISQSVFNDGVRRMLRLYFRVGAFDMPKAGAANTPEHQKLARKVATEAIVLLKNNNNLLPLDSKTLNKIAVIGSNADYHQTMAFGDQLPAKGGSGAVRPPYEVTPLAALQKRFGNKIIYAPGYTFEEKDKPQINDISSAVTAAANADVAIVFVGLNHTLDGEGRGYDSSEANDRKDLELIGPQKELIDAVVKANPKTIVVLINGSPVSMEDWNDKVPSILEAWYGNQEAGNAISDVLFGDANPSGKLPFTIAKKLEDHRVHQFDNLCWPGTGKNGQMEYKESIWVGYRWFDHANVSPLYPFGHGLSYTTFKYSNLVISPDIKDTYKVSVKIANVGKRAGAEVVQFYLIPPDQKGLERPAKELKAFSKLNLLPGEAKTTIVKLNKKDFSYYDTTAGAWKITPGTYTITAASSAGDIRLKLKIVIN